MNFKLISFVYYQILFCAEKFNTEENLCEEAQIASVFEEVYGNIAREIEFQDPNNHNLYLHEPTLVEENDKSDHQLLDQNYASAALISPNMHVTEFDNNLSNRGAISNYLAFSDSNRTASFPKS